MVTTSCFSAPKQETGVSSNAGAPLNTAFYKKYIVTPASTQKVILENADIRLVFAPDALYSITDKKTGETSAGRALFYSELAKSHTALRESAKVFLF
jgi:hypothetical protein